MPSRTEDLAAEAAAELFHGKADHKHSSGSHSSNRVRRSGGSKPKHPKKSPHALGSASHLESLAIITDQEYTIPEHPAPESSRRSREQEVVERRAHVTVVATNARTRSVVVYEPPLQRRKDRPVAPLRAGPSSRVASGLTPTTSYASIVRTTSRPATAGAAAVARPGVGAGARVAGRPRATPSSPQAPGSSVARRGPLKSRRQARRGESDGSAAVFTDAAAPRSDAPSRPAASAVPHGAAAAPAPLAAPGGSAAAAAQEALEFQLDPAAPSFPPQAGVACFGPPGGAAMSAAAAGPPWLAAPSTPAPPDTPPASHGADAAPGGMFAGVCKPGTPPLATGGAGLFPGAATPPDADGPLLATIEAQERAVLGEPRAALRKRVRAKLRARGHTAPGHAVRYDALDAAPTLSVEEHLEGLDIMLGVAEASMVHALTVHHDPGDAARGNVTRAAVTLHHCLQSDLHGYTGLDPWRCGSAEHWQPVVALPPFPLCADAPGAACSHAAFHDQADKLTSMEINLARANEVYCVFTQVDLPAHRSTNNDTGRHDLRTDNLFTRFAVVGREIARDAAARGVSGEGGYARLLARLERFVHDAAPGGLDADDAVHNDDGGGHHDALSVLHYSGSADDTVGGASLGGKSAPRPFCVLFTPPDDQWRPPVVAMIVISILYHLLNSVRYILMHAVDHFRPLPGAREAALRGAHRAVVGRYTAFGERLSDMLVSITEQIARRLLREDRMRSLHGRFRPDSVMWSWLLKQANSTLIIGSRAPQTEFQGGTLEHLARVLLVQQRDAKARGVAASAAPAPAGDAAHLRDDAHALGVRACKRIYRAIDAQLRLLRAALGHMTAALRGPDAPPADDDGPVAAGITEARRRRVVAEYRRLKRDGRSMQFAVYVKNLEGVYDIMRGIIDVANDYEHHGLRNEARDHYVEFQMLSEGVVDVLKAYMVFWLCNMEVLRSYLRDHELDFRWCEAAQQYLEYANGQPQHHVRGFSRYTLDALACVLQNGYLTVHYLMLLRDKTAIARPGTHERPGAWDSDKLAAYARAQISKDLCEHIVQTLLEAGTVDPRAVEDFMLCEEEQVAQLIASAEQSREQHAAVLLAHLRGHARKRHMIMQLCLSRRRVAADPEWHEANSTIGWVHKHALELPDRTEVNVAIKWIQLCGASRGSSGTTSAALYTSGHDAPDAAADASFDSLKRERKYLMRVTDSLMPELGLPRAAATARGSALSNGLGDAAHSASASSLANGGAAAPADGLTPPESGIPEHANVVVGYGLCSSLPMAMTKKLDRNDFRPSEVMENTKVGVGMEFLPIGTVGDLLCDRRNMHAGVPHLSLRIAIDAMMQHVTDEGARGALRALQVAAAAWEPPKGGRRATGAADDADALAVSLFELQRIHERTPHEAALLRHLGPRLAALVPLRSAPNAPTPLRSAPNAPTPRTRGGADGPFICFPSRAPTAPDAEPRLCLTRYHDDSRGLEAAPGLANSSGGTSATHGSLTSSAAPSSPAAPTAASAHANGAAPAVASTTWASVARKPKRRPRGKAGAGPARHHDRSGGGAPPRGVRAAGPARPLQVDPATRIELFHSFAGVFSEHYTECGAKEATCRAAFQRVLAVLAAVSFRWCLQVMLGMAKGVALCHRLGVVHRDINVHNFMFDGWGRVKLIDFASAAKVGARQEKPPQDHVVFQPPGARSVEPQRASAGAFLHRAEVPLDMPDASTADDVWSLGMALWTVVFLRPLHGTAQTRNPLTDSWDHSRQDGAAVQHSQELLCDLHGDHCEPCVGLRNQAAAACKCESDARRAPAPPKSDPRRHVSCHDCQHALRKEDYWTHHVPPLPEHERMRAVLFRDTDGRAATEARWIGEGLPQLRSLFVAMFRLRAAERISALEVARCLQQLLDDFPTMV